MAIGARENPDSRAGKEERGAFDHMDKFNIDPILNLVEQFQSKFAPDDMPEQIVNQS